MSNQDINRRKVLRSVALASGTLAMGTGNSSAKGASRISTEKRVKMMEEAASVYYNDEAAMMTALSDYTQEIILQLRSEGFSAPDEVSGLQLRTFPDWHEDTATAHIVAEYDDNGAEISIHVLPQADYAFAFERSTSGARKYDLNGVGPTTLGPCYYEDYCECGCNPVAPEPGCDPNYTAQYRVTQECCEQGGVTSCETIDRTCDTDCGGCCG